jgi:hypothetical protein
MYWHSSNAHTTVQTYGMIFDNVLLYNKKKSWINFFIWHQWQMDLCTYAHTVTYRKWLKNYGIFNNQSSQEEGMQTFIHKNRRP